MWAFVDADNYYVHGFCLIIGFVQSPGSPGNPGKVLEIETKDKKSWKSPGN